jgi:hypothetical protein
MYYFLNEEFSLAYGEEFFYFFKKYPLNQYRLTSTARDCWLKLPL